MELNLIRPGLPLLVHEAELVDPSEYTPSGAGRLRFRGPFPVDPTPFQYPPIPPPPPGEIEGPIKFRVYERLPPPALVTWTAGSFYYQCAVVEATPDWFEVVCCGGASLRALERLRLASW